MATATPPTARSLAIVTGASTGIGYELAKICAQEGFDLVVAAKNALQNLHWSALKQIGEQASEVKA